MVGLSPGRPVTTQPCGQPSQPPCLLRLPPRDSAARHSLELRRGTSHCVRPAVLLRSLTHTLTLWEGGRYPHPQSPDCGDVSASLCHVHGGNQELPAFPFSVRLHLESWSGTESADPPGSGRAGRTSLLLPEPAVPSATAGPTPGFQDSRQERVVTKPAPGEGHRPHRQRSSRPPPVPDLRAHRPAVLPNGPHVGTDQRTRPWPQTKDQVPFHPPVWFCPKPQMAAENKAHFRPLGVLVFF